MLKFWGLQGRDGGEMIRSILLTSSNGLLLFAKEFPNAVVQPRLVASLMVALQEMSKQATGLKVSYMELKNVGVVLVSLENKKLNCVLFQDREDGEDFGRLIASRILTAFADRYVSTLAISHSPSGTLAIPSLAVPDPLTGL